MLTPKQEKFCIEYAKCGNARQAYIKAGYSFSKESTADVNACRLLKTDKVQKRLAELQKRTECKEIADIKEMQEILTRIMRQETTEQIVMVDPVAGIVREEKTASIKDIIGAIEKLGKMQGAFVDRVEEKADVNLSISIDYGEETEE